MGDNTLDNKKQHNDDQYYNCHYSIGWKSGLYLGLTLRCERFLEAYPIQPIHTDDIIWGNIPTFTQISLKTFVYGLILIKLIKCHMPSNNHRPLYNTLQANIIVLTFILIT